MSDEQAESREPDEPTPALNSAETGQGTRPGVSNDLVQLWIKAAGWFVTAMGGVMILAALSWKMRHGMPFFAMVGMILIGAAYVLAGQGLSEGYAWPLPLCVLVVFRFLGPILDPFFLLMIGVAVYRKYRRGRLPKLPSMLNRNLGPNAETAYGLWVVGISLLLLQHLIRL